MIHIKIVGLDVKKLKRIETIVTFKHELSK